MSSYQRGTATRFAIAEALAQSAASASAVKKFFHGTHRCKTPARTLDAIRPFMPIMGITRVANVTGLDRVGIPVVMVCRPNSRCLAVSQGKGLDLESAKASGVMEAIESYHAEHITLPLKFAAYHELRYTHVLADVYSLPITKTPRFDPFEPMLWIAGEDLLQRGDVWVPYASVSTNFTKVGRRVAAGFLATSNGLASGNCLLEALSHGICEVVERDAYQLWQLKSEGHKHDTQLDLDSVDDPDCRELLEKFGRANMRVEAWDITSDVGIAAFRCVIADNNCNAFHKIPFAGGSGCHPSRSIALLRSLTEAAQSRLTFIAGSRDDKSRKDHQIMYSDETAQLAETSKTIDGGMRHYLRAPDHVSDNILDDVTWELQQLSRAGIERVIAVDLTRKEFGLPVVRVVVPGLEPHADPRHYYVGKRARSIWEKTN